MTVNKELLRATLDQVKLAAEKEGPEAWDQRNWRCNTGMCFAGHAVTLSGAKWADALGGDYEECVIAEGDDPESAIYGAYFDDHTIKVVNASRRAQRILGLGYSAADRLFDEHNDLDDLEMIVNELCGEPDSIAR